MSIDITHLWLRYFIPKGEKYHNIFSLSISSWVDRETRYSRTPLNQPQFSHSFIQPLPGIQISSNIFPWLRDKSLVLSHYYCCTTAVLLLSTTLVWLSTWLDKWWFLCLVAVLFCVYVVIYCTFLQNNKVLVLLGFITVL